MEDEEMSDAEDSKAVSYRAGVGVIILDKERMKE
jgi:hypothetical protein